jgi:hypothetical protein
MLKRIVLAFGILSLAVASAATYKVTLFQPSIVKGTELKAGEYKVDVTGDKVVIMNGKSPLEVAAKVETGERKFSSTSVRYSNQDGKYTIAEIRIGGTKTTLVFNQ